MSFFDEQPVPGTIGYRIREERLRLEMTEAEFSEKAGLELEIASEQKGHRVQEMEIETNAGSTSLTWDEIASMAIIKVDVQYVLIGQRSQIISSEEQALIDNYRASTEADRKSLRSVGNAFAKSRLMDDNAGAGGD